MVARIGKVDDHEARCHIDSYWPSLGTGPDPEGMFDHRSTASTESWDEPTR